MHTSENDLELTHLLADDAGHVILPHFRALPEVENKDAAGFDPVTVADRAAEKAIRSRLQAERPDDGILGEEFAGVDGTSGRTWVLDPIDGTRGFMAGLPTWGVLIALGAGGRVDLGMMAQPFVGERFYASRDGAFLDGVRGTTALRTRRCANLSEAIVACTSPKNFDPAIARQMQALTDTVRMVRYGTDCYGYALLAAGLVDIVIDTGLKPYDIAPFVPIVREAGGALIDRHGADIEPTILSGYKGDGFAVGDPSLAEALVAALA
ncbi:inositol monophosphatase family protein [Acuticoccus sp. MNP-M23]|uniref:inositol monophosphatase family protein n=1 Tax=Acuticoccus sp. MNP-M23 TaxID=3072793 RepID=UPI0028160B98|nr:inositol monophosphatase family protein [Acuticoccus sp. MNP-M23]WMS43720.1 inositol monophosphatase family protein [Acuticoccus sp. MNP-M23]